MLNLFHFLQTKTYLEICMKTVFDEVRDPHVGRRLPHVVRPRVLEGVERIGREERREEGEEQNQQDRHQLHYRRETVLLQEVKHERNLC